MPNDPSSGGTVTSVSAKLLNNVPLQAVREQREARSEGKESQTGDNQTSRTAAGGGNINESGKRYPQ